MKFYSAALNVHSFEMYLECCTPPHPHPPPVWASASSKWRYFKTVLWHDSCVYALVLLFPTICFMFPPSTLPLCFQPELYLWLIAAIKTGSCWEWEEGLLSHFPSHSCFFTHFLSLVTISSSLLCLLLYLHLTAVMIVALFYARLSWLIAGPRWNMSTNTGRTTMIYLVQTFILSTWWILFRILIRVISAWA